MIKAIYNWLMFGKPIPHLFSNERLVSDIPFEPKKQSPEHHPSWIMKIDPSEAKAARKRWMEAHYGGETHPVDLWRKYQLNQTYGKMAYVTILS